MTVIAPEHRDHLRRLAARCREIADSPEQVALRQTWCRHNALATGHPLVLAFPEGAWGELLNDADMLCPPGELRGLEWGLRARIYTHDVLKDDQAFDPWFGVGWHFDWGSWGVEIPQHQGADRGSFVWDPPIKDLEKDFVKLRIREPKVDRAASQRALEMPAEIFGDLLPVRRRGMLFWTTGLTNELIRLIGLEQLMLAMADQPEALHRLMAWKRDDHAHFMDWAEREGLLTPNTAGDYVGSGGLGYTDELPRRPVADEASLRWEDLWGFSESQETVGISPRMFTEFILPYQVPLLNRFGLACYACCEGIDKRIDPVLAAVPRLRRVSVSPWADQPVMARKLAGRCIYSRKPNPALICISFDEAAIRADLAQTLDLAGGGTLEIIMKDTHTVLHQPWRISRWVELAREEIAKWRQRRA